MFSSYTFRFRDAGAPIHLTTHLLSNERADWPKLHDMFKARDAKTWQREFPIELPVRVFTSNLLLITIFHDGLLV